MRGWASRLSQTRFFQWIHIYVQVYIGSRSVTSNILFMVWKIYIHRDESMTVGRLSQTRFFQCIHIYVHIYIGSRSVTSNTLSMVWNIYIQKDERVGYPKEDFIYLYIYINICICKHNCIEIYSLKKILFGITDPLILIYTYIRMSESVTPKRILSIYISI